MALDGLGLGLGSGALALSQGKGAATPQRVALKRPPPSLPASIKPTKNA